MSYPNEINDYSEYEDAFVSKYRANLAPRFLGLGIPRGWRSIVEDFMDTLIGTDYKVIQIKEKFGGLRIYINSPTKAEYVTDAYAKAVELASQTCAICGKPGKLYAKGWMNVYCEEHTPETDD